MRCARLFNSLAVKGASSRVLKDAPHSPHRLCVAWDRLLGLKARAGSGSDRRLGLLLVLPCGV